MREFRSFRAFSEHLLKLAAVSGEVKRHILDKAGEEVQKSAQGMIGEYQGAVGPFVAWQELAESTQAERSRLGYSENDPGFRSGAMQRSVQRTVVGEEMAVGSNDQHLVWFDMGTPTQPPRPVLGPAALHSRDRVKAIMGATAFAWVAGLGWRRPRLPSV